MTLNATVNTVYFTRASNKNILLYFSIEKNKVLLKRYREKKCKKFVVKILLTSNGVDFELQRLTAERLKLIIQHAKRINVITHVKDRDNPVM